MVKHGKFWGTLLSFVFIFTCLTAVTTADDNPSSSNDAVNLYGGQSYAEVNGNTVWLEGEIIQIGTTIYVAPDPIFRALGCGMGWDDELQAVVLCKDGVTSYIIFNTNVLWKGPDLYESENKTFVYKNVFYIPLDMFTYFTKCSPVITGDVPVISRFRRDLLEDTYVGNDYRRSPATGYGSVWVAGNFGMEKLYITDSVARAYASAVNYVAENLPEEVNIFNIVIPSASEFYGPSSVYTNQTSGIRTIYQNLSSRVIPINAVKPLYAHAGENIYFRTDHHWTQRGAYYAYKEFMDVKGEEVPPLSAFPLRTGSYVGSLAGFTKGTYAASVFKSNPDTIERFLSTTYTNGAVYKDMYMQSYDKSVQAVYADINSYIAFIGGDNPLTVFTTNVNNGKKIVIIKESFGNAFATWALNNYSEVYVVDARKFGNGGPRFNLKDFYNFVHYDDLVIINYPGGVSSSAIISNLYSFING